eukprot:5479973-Pyramimonas_sp.AAC.1
MGMCAEEDTFMNIPTVSTSHPYTYDGYPAARIFEKSPITEEEVRGGAAKAHAVRQYPKSLDYSANAMN